jgi:hypothetical protein
MAPKFTPEQLRKMTRLGGAASMAAVLGGSTKSGGTTGVNDLTPSRFVDAGVQSPVQRQTQQQTQSPATTVFKQPSSNGNATGFFDRVQNANAEFEKRFNSPSGGDLMEVIRGKDKTYIDFKKSDQEFASPAEAILGMSFDNAFKAKESESKEGYAQNAKAGAIALLGENARENTLTNVALQELEGRRGVKKEEKEKLSYEEMMQLLMSNNK